MANYAGVPVALVVDRGLSAAAKVTANWMCCFADRHGAGHVSLETIALLMGVELRQVQKKVTEMIERGHLVKMKAARNKDGEWLRGFQFIFKETSLKDVIAERKAALKDAFTDQENVLPAQQKRPLGVEKTSSGDAPLRTPFKHRLKQKKERGSRLPADAVLPDDWKAWAKAARPDLDPETIFADFRDYWIAATGANACKADWLATWRRWVRKERTPHGQHRSSKTPHSNGFAQLILDDLDRSGSRDELAAAGFNPGDDAG